MSEVSPPRTDREIEQVTDILTWSFIAFSANATPRLWVERVGLENLRIWRDNGNVAGTLAMLPMGQYYGGVSVPMGGIAAVGVDASYRGRGIAKKLMVAALEELHTQHVPLSVLYPATRTLYRRVGYESAGCRFELRVTPRAIGRLKGTLDVRLLDDDDLPAVRALYESFARHHNGTIWRSDYLWLRHWKPANELSRRFGVYRDGKLEGYMLALQRPSKEVPGHSDLVLTDILAGTRDAGLTLLAVLADHSSLSETITWYGGSHDPIAMLLTERDYSVKLMAHWMLRIVDVVGALEARRYRAGASGELHLEVRDDVLSHNHGRFVLSVTEGRGTVRPGGQGGVSLDVRDLAALYTGFQTPHDLQATGSLVGDDAGLATAAALFSGSAPWMSDFF
jgi:predicted acetyltransferase